MRAFIAVLPPPEIIQHLEEFVAPRRGSDSGLWWATPEQFHLTLAFLPDLAEVDVDALCERLDSLAEQRPPLGLRIAGGGVFPDAAGAKVVWAGVHELTEDPRLARLARNCRNAAAVSGTRVDGTRFTAHVTLARYGRATDATRWLRVFDAYEGPPWEAREIALVQSRLGQGRQGRPAYDVLDTVELRGGGAGRG